MMLSFEERIVGAFDLIWPGEYRKNFHGSVPAGANPFISFDSDPLTNDDVAALANATKTLYVVLRLSWVDETGRWASDLCAGYQDKLFTSEVTHPCIDPKATQVRHAW